MKVRSVPGQLLQSPAGSQVASGVLPVGLL
jgi:hypothetical protein